MNRKEQEARLRYTCPHCGGHWRAKEDAKLCHGMEPCTKETDCAAISHFGDCKSMSRMAQVRATTRTEGEGERY